MQQIVVIQMFAEFLASNLWQSVGNVIDLYWRSSLDMSICHFPTTWGRWISKSEMRVYGILSIKHVFFWMQMIWYDIMWYNTKWIEMKWYIMIHPKLGRVAATGAEFRVQCLSVLCCDDKLQGGLHVSWLWMVWYGIVWYSNLGQLDR